MWPLKTHIYDATDTFSMVTFDRVDDFYVNRCKEIATIQISSHNNPNTIMKTLIHAV